MFSYKFRAFFFFLGVVFSQQGLSETKVNSSLGESIPADDYQSNGLLWSYRVGWGKNNYKFSEQDFSLNYNFFALGVGFYRPHSILWFHVYGESGPAKESSERSLNMSYQGVRVSSSLNLFKPNLFQAKENFFVGSSLGFSYQDSTAKTIDSESSILALAQEVLSTEEFLIHQYMRIRTLDVQLGPCLFWKSNRSIKISNEISYIRLEGFVLQLTLNYPLYGEWTKNNRTGKFSQDANTRTLQLNEQEDKGRVKGYSFLASLTAYVGP